MARVRYRPATTRSKHKRAGGIHSRLDPQLATGAREPPTNAGERGRRLIVGLTSVILAALLWSSRQL